jgi:succinylarginine dihydrolase
MTAISYEVNFDALPGLTHFYGGLALGNLPSMENEGIVSKPKRAALQSLEKMLILHKLGVKQALLPPHERPYLPVLPRLGYANDAEAALKTLSKEAPWLLAAISSSSGMWAANAATVSPSIDSINNHVNFTPANLVSNFHRAIETDFTANVLRRIFANPVFFEHHAPLPSSTLFADEGAANHMRFCRHYNGPGVELFVYGVKHSELSYMKKTSEKYPARQSYEASAAISRLHTLYPENTLFAQQSPLSIDTGAFHADLIATNNQNVLLFHENSFLDQEELLEMLNAKIEAVCDCSLIQLEVSEEELPLDEALKTFFFNSQIVTLPDNSMAMILPIECQSSARVGAYLKKVLEDNANPITQIHYVDLRESMQNGGGPACLRLRVVLSEVELGKALDNVFFSDMLYERLTDHVNRYYPDTLTKEQLGSIELYKRSLDSLAEITRILNLGKIYPFQK